MENGQDANNDKEVSFQKRFIDEDTQFLNNQDIYAEIECSYMSSMLKKNSKSYKSSKLLEEIHEKAKNTLLVLTKNMVCGDVPLLKIFEMYSEINRENAIVLLLRCKKMYEARHDVRRLLVFFLEKNVNIILLYLFSNIQE